MIENSIYKSSLLKIIGAIVTDNSNILVTGASGLIGSCLVDVFMLANEKGKQNNIFAMGRSKVKLERRFERFINSKNFHIIEQNVCEPLDDKMRFDFIIHGASNADPVSYANYPVETMTTNIIGSYNIMEYGRKHAYCKITVLSTFEVYGNAGKDKYTEKDSGVIDLNSLRSCYPESKRSVEILSRCYAEEFGLKVNVARLSSVYGPTMATDDSKAHAQFLHNALYGNDILLKSEGASRRTYTYVLDAVTGILTILFKGELNETYNVSNENAIASIAEVAHICADLAGTKVVFDLPSKIESKGFSKPQNCILDNTKLKSLGWQGQYSVYEGMKESYYILKDSKETDLVCSNYHAI